MTSDQANMIDKPAMTKAETALLEECLRVSTAYYEYGVGGSTVFAHNMGLKVFGVDNDNAWVEKVLEAAPQAMIDRIDMGELEPWGFPVDSEPNAAWMLYSKNIGRVCRSVDLVLVDGRFRVACFIQAILLCKVGTRILLHDCTRPAYRVVKKWAMELKQVKSLALFEKRELSEAEAAEIQTAYDEKYWRQVK